MVVQTAKQAVANANSFKSCTPGMCLKYTRTWLEIPSKYPSAIEAWKGAKHKHRDGVHRDAQTPPRGAPVFWSGGKYGHIALAVNNETGRSTDTRRSGQVGTAEGDWWKNNWGAKYLGWTEDLNGVLIPYLKDGGKSQWASGTVYVSKLHLGQLDSDSVARLCYRLRNHSQLGAKAKPERQIRSYRKEIVDAVRFWQRQVRPNVAGPSDGESLSNDQANILFGKNYVVIEKK